MAMIDRGSKAPLIFVSHDSRDAEVAQQFCQLLENASLRMLRTFCSSDRTGKRGIAYGAQWFGTILENLKSASEVICLLTPRSINRPWILYEAGVAAGQLDTAVKGVVLGLSLSEANQGPFAQLQNCAGDSDAIAVLVAKIIKNLIPTADPPEEAIRSLAEAFVRATTPLLAQIDEGATTSESRPPEVADSALSARMLEEIKEVVYSLPARLEERLPRADIVDVIGQLREAIKATEATTDAAKRSLAADSEDLHCRIEEIRTIVEDRLAKIPAISSLLKCGILNIHEDRPAAEAHIISLLNKAKSHIEIIGISLRSLFQGGGKLNKAILDMLAGNADRRRELPTWRVMVLDPQCEQAKYRSEREEPPESTLADCNLSREVELTTKVVDNWRRRGCNIELRLYRGSPSCFLMIIDNAIFVEQYHYGRAGGARVAELVPLLEYGSDSNTYRELLGHFEYLWERLSRSYLLSTGDSQPNSGLQLPSA